MNENHIDHPQNDTPVIQPTKDMTQRVRLEDAMEGATRPAGSASVNPRRNRNKRRWYMTKKEKITLISLASVTAVLLIAAIILISTMFAAPTDDGRILKGVMAAGVNIGGMTQEQAASALEKATADTYAKLPMVVTVLDSQVTLFPQATGAQLDIQAVVQDAYNYGRTGSRAERNEAKEYAQSNSVIIPVTPHLNLNTDYIRSELNKLGAQFSSTLSQPKISLSGTRPQMGVDDPNTETIHQTLTIYVGTAEYGLDINKLFDQVMEYYNINIFQMVGTCTVIAPDSIEDELLSYYADLCVEPVDAQMDPLTYEVTPEVYGYGFNLDEVKEQIAKTPYGETITIPLRYLAPNVTEELLSDNLFRDVIGEYTSLLGADTAWNQNATLACEILNGLILKSGDSFSFNELLGELTAEKGYQSALAYLGRVNTSVMGGGVAHTASVLYNSVLAAELEILERHNHAYAPTFIEVGRDAYVNNGTADFRFRNNRPDPIRIKAEVVEGMIQITIEGTDSRDYIVDVVVTVTDTLEAGTLYTTMLPNNPGGYQDGDILSYGKNGYEVEITCLFYNKQDGLLQGENLIGTDTYEAQDNVVAKIQDPNTPSGTPDSDLSDDPTQ